MGKQSFKFSQDEKMTIWFRTEFTVEAETYEEALKIIKKEMLAGKSVSDTDHDSISIGDREYLLDTAINMFISDNDNQCTVEILNDDNGEVVWANVEEE